MDDYLDHINNNNTQESASVEVEMLQNTLDLIGSPLSTSKLSIPKKSKSIKALGPMKMHYCFMIVF